MVPMPLSLWLRWEREKMASLAAATACSATCGSGARGPWRGAEQAQHLVHRQGAGDLPGRGAAHAVTDHIDAVLDGETECIFVGRALAAAVGNRRSRVVDDSRGQKQTPIAQFTRVGKSSIKAGKGITNVAEEFAPEGGGGFNLRIKPAELSWASAPEGCVSGSSPSCPPFPAPRSAPALHRNNSRLPGSGPGVKSEQRQRLKVNSVKKWPWNKILVWVGWLLLVVGVTPGAYIFVRLGATLTIQKPLSVPVSLKQWRDSLRLTSRRARAATTRSN